LHHFIANMWLCLIDKVSQIYCVYGSNKWLALYFTFYLLILANQFTIKFHLFQYHSSSPIHLYNPLILVSTCSLSLKILEEEDNLLGVLITQLVGIQLSIPQFLGTCKEVNLSIYLGFLIGFTATYIQEWINNFLRNSKLLAKYYEPPTSLGQDVTWFRAVRSL